MLFLQMKTRMNTINKILGFFLAVFIVAGCIDPKVQPVKTAEQIQTGSEISDKSAIIQGDRQISAVSVELEKYPIEIKIRGNQKLAYTSIKQSFPFGIAIYFPETGIAEDFKMAVPENNSIGDLTVTYVDEERTIAKVEILLKEDLNYEVTENGSILMVRLFGDIEENQTIVNNMPEPIAIKTDKNSQESVVPEETIIIPDRTAKMTHIEFNTMADGKSDIVVQTDYPVKYDITPASSNKLYLNLYNTIIPEYHKRPLLTQYFKSAVEELMPIQVPGEKKNSKIEIKIRDQVPYRIVQTQNIISLFFEPSSVEPPVFGKANKKVTSGTQVGESQDDDPTEESQTIFDQEMTWEDQIYGVEKKYTGEKIQLDFYKTDIKNVFRILRSVAGANFAIDDDVEGKVTLTFQNALPWDQVLDLILTMNKLGQKQEGDVIRIATLETIKEEELAKQAAIAARVESLEQRRKLKPLITVYLPINYADASAMAEHIIPILTGQLERKGTKKEVHLIESGVKYEGKISVDGRTNTIILTDTQEVIDKAKEIIYELDKVTPQIMIEAKVVEVSKDFSRELGLGLSFENSQTEYTGRSQDFTLALNNPIAAPVTAGSFNFYRILGSNFLSMNAQIAASESKGDLKVMSSPRILALDNKKARIKQGLEYPYLERDDAGGSSVKFKAIDLLLEVTPHVTSDKRIVLKIYLTKNDIDSITGGIPALSTNEANTELLVNNNDTIVIGGIIKTTDRDDSSGTPILSGIPILGRLFRTDLNKNKRTELLIFLTPSIVQLEQKTNTFTTAD